MEKGPLMFSLIRLMNHSAKGITSEEIENFDEIFYNSLMNYSMFPTTTMTASSIITITFDPIFLLTYYWQQLPAKAPICTFFSLIIAATLCNFYLRGPNQLWDVLLYCPWESQGKNAWHMSVVTLRGS